MTATREPATRPSPYQGLRSFTEADAEFFRGREHETEVITAQLKASRLTVLYGPSGVGKTSLLRAGVLAGMERAARASRFHPVYFNDWREDANRALAASITAALGGDPDHSAARSPVEAIGAAAGLRAGTRLLLILDQFEDLRDGAADAEFGAILPPLVRDPKLPVNVLIALREDALAWLDHRFRKPIPSLLDVRMRVRPLSRDAATRAITGPLDTFNRGRAKAEQIRCEPGLITAVIDQLSGSEVSFEGNGQPTDTEHGPGNVQAPYLQLAMRAVWDWEMEHGSLWLREATFETELGGAQAIVSGHLDAVLGGLTPDQRELAVVMFDRLVLPSGAEVVMRIPDLAALSQRDPGEVRKLVTLLESDGRRVLRPVPAPPSHPDQDGVEIFHDVLGPGILAWRRRELEAEAQRQRRRAWVFGAIAAVSVGLLVAGIAVFVAIQIARANHAHRTAESDTLAGQALADLGDGHTDRGSLLSMVAFRLAPTAPARDDLLYAQEDTLDMRAYLGNQDGQATALAYAPGTLAVGTADGTIALYDVRTLRRVRTLGGGRLGFIQSLAVSPDGRLLAAATSSGTVEVWSTAGWAPAAALPAGGPANAVAFGPGDLLAAGAADGTITVWNRRGAVVRQWRGAADRIDALAFVSGGELASSAEDGMVRIWKAATGAPVHAWSGDGAGTMLAFDGPRDILASGGADGRITLRVLPGGRAVELPPQGSAVDALAFNPAGTGLATGGDDGRVRLYALSTEIVLTSILRGQTSKIESVAFDASGSTLASASDDKSVALWNAAPALPPSLDAGAIATAAIPGAPPSAYALAVGPGGGTVAAGVAGGVIVWPPGQDLGIQAPRATVTAVAISPARHLLVATTSAGAVRLWQLPAMTPLPALPPAAGSLNALALADDGTLLAAAGGDGTVYVWDLSRRRLLRRLSVDRNPLYALAMSPDGQTIAAAGDDDAIFVWGPGGTAPEHTLYGHTGPVEALALSPTGDLLASGGQDHSVILWNVRTGLPVGNPLHGHVDGVTSVAFSGDGRLLASGSLDGSVIVWNVATRLGQPLTGFPGDAVRAVAWAGDELFAATTEGLVERFRAVPSSGGPQSIFARLCAVADRTLTVAEWRQFVPGQSYERVCSPPS